MENSFEFSIFVSIIYMNINFNYNMEKVTNFNDSIFAEDVVPTGDKFTFPRENGKSKATSSKKSPKQKKYEDFTINLFGDDIDVCFHDKVFSDTDPEMWIFGNCNFAERVINISLQSPSGRLLTSNQIKQTFVHEMVHIMLESGQYYNQSYNEGLVEWLAKCINMMFFSNATLSKHF